MNLIRPPTCNAKPVRESSCNMCSATNCPAANKLVAFRLLTSSAVIGPGISDPEPTAAHVWFVILNCATFAAVLSESEIDPPA